MNWQEKKRTRKLGKDSGDENSADEKEADTRNRNEEKK
jgi:hypothetical protein